MLPPAESVAACLEVARTMERDGRDLQAAIEYERARRFDPRLQLSSKLAILYDRLGKDKLALAEYQNALKKNPKDANLLNNFGYYYFNRGEFKLAEQYYRKALAIDAEHKVARINLGMALAQQDRVDESLEAFERAVGKAQAHCNLAFALTTQGKRELAKEHYRIALSIDSSLTKARQALRKLETAGASPAPPQPGAPGRFPLTLPDRLPADVSAANEPVPDLSPIQVPVTGEN